MRQTDRCKPLIHCITNYVTAESIANEIIVAGGSPVMADDLCEVEEVTASADALLLNLGTPSPSRIEAMLVAGRTANRLGIPVFLDPVGCGATGFRLEAVKRLLTQIRFHTIRGNASEMVTIHTGERAKTLGVDADPSLEIRADALEPWISVARSIAEKYRCRAIITGHCDVNAVPRGETVEVTTLEHPQRTAKQSTGGGCRMTARLAVEAARAKDLSCASTGCEVPSDLYGEHNPYLLYAITERYSASSDYLGKIESALASGVTMLQFREKELKGEPLLGLARDVQRLCRKYGVPFIVNDSVDLAVAVGADGVHLGQKDDAIEEARTRLPGKIVGMTAHSYQEARDAVERGADYIGVGAMFPTRSKADAKELPIPTLIKIRNNTPIPVVAIGGIAADNIGRLEHTGIDGVAVISALFGQENVGSATRAMRDLLRGIEHRSASYHLSRPVRCLTIAGSDSSGGAGIQADLKTFAALGVYGMSVVTAITAQNTCGVTAVHDIPVDVVAAQLDAVFQDIRPDAVKIGMVSNPELIQAIADRLRAYRPRVIVLDPVMVSTSGCSLISDGAFEKLASELIPIATLITPNIPEAEILLGRSIAPAEQIEAALALFDRFQVPVLLKGGHFEGEKVDVLADRSGIECFALPPVDNPNTHGTGCTLSSAIASGCALAMRGFFVCYRDSVPSAVTLRTAIREAKQFVRQAISRRLNIGEERGPLDHIGYR